MEIQNIKQIAITDYLQQQGYAPARVQGIHYWYYSPLRNERTPSFKVNTERNQWYDFGSGEHGDIIDLVCALHRCTISEAIRLLSGAKQVAYQEFSFGGERKNSERKLEILSAQPLSNPNLLRYLAARAIPLPIAKAYCSEVLFQNMNRTYYAIGFANDALGWKAIQKGKKLEAEIKEVGDEHILSSLPNLTEGEVLPLVNADITDHKTKPKPLYTEATLLSAMENAGKDVKEDDKRKAMAECGIGTPATRANIIETLILRDYIRRDKKSIIPTEKGLTVYEIVKDKKIANAEMTGAWELAFAAIEAGKMPSERFSQGINSYVGTICEELLSLSSEQKSYPVYRRPKCGQQSVGIYAKVAKCRHETCGFHVFRDVCGILLSEDHIRDLISSDRTPILKGLTSKAGKKFNARLVLKDDYTTTFEFEQNKKRK